MTQTIREAMRRDAMRLPRMTTRDMMIAVAAVGLILGVILEAPWIIVLILITSPQSIVVAACAYLAIRDANGRPREPRGTRSCAHRPGSCLGAAATRRQSLA